MIITEQMIRELQKRVDVSYEEAEGFLRRARGNLDIAERHALRRENSVGRRLIRQIEKLIDGALTYRIKVFKNEDLYMNVPILAFVILFIIVGLDKILSLGLVFILVSLFTDSSIAINKVVRKNEFSFRTVHKDKQSEYNNKANKDKTEKVEEKGQEKGQPSLDHKPNEQGLSYGEYKHDDDDDDDYYEVTIDK